MQKARGLSPESGLHVLIQTVLFLPLLTKGQLCLLPDSFVPHATVIGILTSYEMLHKVIINKCDKKELLLHEKQNFNFEKMP